MVGIKGLIGRIFGNSGNALEEQQSSGDARIGQLKREFMEHPSKGLTPAKLYQILEAAEQGDLKAQHELFEDMEEKDPQIAADLGKRRQLAAELEWQIAAPDNATPAEQRATDHAVEVFSGLDVEDLIIEMGSGIGHGWANLELPWARDGALRYVEQPEWRPHSWFRLNPEDQNELRLRDASAIGAELWPLGWVQHRHRAKAGYVARAGLHRVLAWPYLFQNYALGDLAELLELYGLPIRIGRYPSGASEKDKATLLRAVVGLGHNAAGIIPDSMRIDFQDAADGKADMFLAMLGWCERAKARAILGGTLTSGTSGDSNTNALGNVHERSQMSLIRSDARQYASTINRDILWPMAALNFGIEDRRRAPRFFLDTGEADDLKLLAETLPTFVGMGAKIPVWWLHEKSRIPQAGEKDAVLMSTPAMTGVSALKRGLGAGVVALKADTGTAATDQAMLDAAIEAIGAEALDAQARELLAPVLERLKDAGDQDPAKLLGWLAETYPTEDGGQLEERLARLLWAAQMWGTLNGDA
ncbi:MAG: hypothetical protein CGU28_03170 [Candidatus Dactylopiibacterium carminicum]|nr:MAG: hypothetical protein CGU28_03170 [Candidatus Dactylopiibacterium carminicum]